MTDADKLAFLRRLRDIADSVHNGFAILAEESARKLADDLVPHKIARLNELRQQARRPDTEHSDAS